MGWPYLLVASLFEVLWAVGLKYTDGLTRPVPTVLTVGAMLASFWFLAKAAQTLPIGTAYAAWTGIGVLGTAVLGMILFGEPRPVTRLLFIALILAGIVGLKLTANSAMASDANGIRATSER